MRTQNTNIPEDRNRISKILLVFYWILLLLSIVVIGKIIYIQFIWEPPKQSLENFIPNNKCIRIKPERGDIMDCNRRILASSTPLYTIRLDCQIQKKELEKRTLYFGKDSLTEAIWRQKAKESCKALPEILGGEKTAEDYYNQIILNRESKDKPGRRNVKFIRNIDHSTLLKIKQLPLFRMETRFSGMMLDTIDARKHPYGELGRRVIGDVRIDPKEPKRNRFLGIEGEYNHILHGKDGVQWMKVADEGAILNPDSTSVEVEHGSDIITTLDIGIQDIADKALRKHIFDDEAIEGGCVVVMEVETGKVKAMVNIERNEEGEFGEYFNMAIGRAGDPGSIFKSVTLMTLLEDGKVNLDTEIATNSGVLKGYSKIPVDETLRRYEKATGKKTITVREGFMKSSNYVFRYLALKHYCDNENSKKQFTDRLFEYNLHDAYRFDLTEKGSKSSLRSQWSTYDLLSTAIGYSIVETPLNMLAFYNAIANDGKMMKPYIIEAFEKSGKVTKEFKPVILNGSICSKATADTLTEALKAVAQDGTARRLRSSKCPIAGKTGTARVVLDVEDKPKPDDAYVNVDGYRKYQATFVGFFPADEPKYSAIVTVYTKLTKSDSYGGGNHPAKVFGEVVDNLWALESEWGNQIEERSKMPEMKAQFIGTRKGKSGPIPDVKGMGLKDAVYAIENNGYKCSYEGIGHVVSQNPAAGTEYQSGKTVHIRLK